MRLTFICVLALAALLGTSNGVAVSKEQPTRVVPNNINSHPQAGSELAPRGLRATKWPNGFPFPALDEPAPKPDPIKPIIPIPSYPHKSLCHYNCGMTKPCKCQVQEPCKCCYALGCAICLDPRPCDPNNDKCHSHSNYVTCQGDDCSPTRQENLQPPAENDPDNCHACDFYAMQCATRSRADCTKLMCDGYDVPSQCKLGGKCQYSQLFGDQNHDGVTWCNAKSPWWEPENLVNGDGTRDTVTDNRPIHGNINGRAQSFKYVNLCINLLNCNDQLGLEREYCTDGCYRYACFWADSTAYLNLKKHCDGAGMNWGGKKEFREGIHLEQEWTVGTSEK